MDPAVVPFDLQRMLVGGQSLLFGLEVLVRTLVIYAYALVLLRWLGSRTIGQLSTVEFLLVIALGSAVGDPMFYPDVPLVFALLVVTIVVLANKGLDILIARSKRAERMIDGTPAHLIEDGVLCRSFLDRSSHGLSEVFQQLRRRGIVQLGQVRHAFAEPDGEVTVFRTAGAVPAGLPIVPPWEVRDPGEIAAGRSIGGAAVLACMRCGFVTELEAGQAADTCPHCGHDTWTPARSEGDILTREAN